MLAVAVAVAVRLTYEGHCIIPIYICSFSLLARYLSSCDHLSG